MAPQSQNLVSRTAVTLSFAFLATFEAFLIAYFKE